MRLPVELLKDVTAIVFKVRKMYSDSSPKNLKKASPFLPHKNNLSNFNYFLEQVQRENVTSPPPLHTHVSFLYAFVN